MGDSHVTVTIVWMQRLSCGDGLCYYSPLGSSAKSHRFNGTFNIKQTLGTNISFLTPFSAFWIPSLNSTKTSFRKFVFKWNEPQQLISLVQRELSHDSIHKSSEQMSWDVSPPEYRSWWRSSGSPSQIYYNPAVEELKGLSTHKYWFEILTTNKWREEPL